MNNVLIVVCFLIGLDAVQKGGGGERIVFIRHSGETKAIDVPSHATVGELFDIAHAAGLPHSTPLSFEGEELIDLDAQLCDLGIGAEAVLDALSPVFFEGAQMERFDVEGRFARLERMAMGRICFAHKTKIGQVSKLTIKVTQSDRSSVCFSAEDNLAPVSSGTSNLGCSTFYVFDQAGDDETTITVNAKERNHVKVSYEEKSSGRRKNVNLNQIYVAYHRLTDDSEIQICVNMMLGDDYNPETIEFVNFEVSTLKQCAH